MIVGIGKEPTTLFLVLVRKYCDHEDTLLIFHQTGLQFILIKGMHQSCIRPPAEIQEKGLPYL